MKTVISNAEKIGFMMSPSLGDALISMIISNNLRQNGYEITVFNNFLYELRGWFPDNHIQPWPALEDSRAILEKFDLLVYVYDYNDKEIQAEKWHPNVIFLDNFPINHHPISLCDIQVAICKEFFGVKNPIRSNGMLQGPDNRFRSKPQQVAIHPTASSPDRFWLPSKFVALAKQLTHQGYQPVFMVSPKEKEMTSWIQENNLQCLNPTSIDAIAQFIYESGWFIGNNSGLGHLASSLGIPTVILMSRRSLCKRWTPGFAPAKTLLPSIPLLFRSWKMNYWKYFVSVADVLEAFRQICIEHPIAVHMNELEVV